MLKIRTVLLKTYSFIQMHKICNSYDSWSSSDQYRHSIIRPTAEKANFESLIGLVFNLLSVKAFDKNRKI